MHLGIVTPEYPPAQHGGSGSSYRDLAEGLAGLGHKVTVVGFYSRAVLDSLPPDKKISNLRVVRLLQTSTKFSYRFALMMDRWRITQWLNREHKNNPFDVVECSDYSGWLRFGGPKNVPTVVRIRGSNLFFDDELNRKGDPFEHQIEKKCLLRATHLASVSRYAARKTLQLCGVKDRPCQVIYNGVDTELFSPSKEIKTEPGLIVFANTLNPKKGIEQLVDAMNIIAANYSEARLVVIGHETGPTKNGQTYTEQLRQRVRPEFRSRAVFTGRLDRHNGVLPYLQKAHICCYPSHMETFGIAPLEAMSVGKPTIFSTAGPGPEILDDGISGLLCDPTSPEDIARKISGILNDSCLAEKLGQNARARVLAVFDKKNWLARNLEFFESCMRRQ